MTSEDTPRSDPRLDAARGYIARGWRLVLNNSVVDGQCTCSKGKSCENPGKHPLHSGWLDGTVSIADVELHLRLNPNLNLGIITGAVSGLLVLDIDPRHGGDATLRALEADLGPLPATPTVKTGGGGLHYYFHSPEPELKSPPNGLGKGVDVRCKRAQVIAPPSVHGSGQPYVWADGRSPEDVALARLPDAWLARLQKPKQQRPPAQQAGQGGSRLSDEDVLYLARNAGNGDKFTALWDGTSPSGDRSADDLALCALLAFWCSKDAAQMDRLFQKSGRMRSKWTEVHRGDGATYGQMTIETAISGCQEVYAGEQLGAHAGGQGGGTGSNGSCSSPGGPGTAGAPTDPFHLTDLGNALRLITWYGDDLRYVPQWKRWLAWDGRRWRDDDLSTVHRMARMVVERLSSAALANQDSKARKSQLDFAEKSESARAQHAMVDLAASDERVVQRPGDFDRHDWLLNCRNGTLDLRTGTPKAHNRQDLITCCVNAEYDPGATSPIWTTFLDQIFLGNADLVRYVQQVLGMALTASNAAQLLWIFTGSGNNGKNVLLDTIRQVLGDYATKAAPDLLTQAYADRHPTEVADLAGKRLVIASETDEGKRLAISFMKQATGDGTLKARRMRQDFWEFRRTFKLILVTNNLPRVREESNAVWRRLRVVPFDYVVPEAQIDQDLPAKLQHESAGILAWLVRGCLDWQKHGLVEPRIVTERSAEYREREDLIAEFVGDTCVLGREGAVTKTALRAAYTTWCREHGTHPLGSTALTDRILALPGVAEDRTSRTRGFIGIGLEPGYESQIPGPDRRRLQEFVGAMHRKHGSAGALISPAACGGP